MFYFFKKGDAVPQWLETTDIILKFKEDAIVHKTDKIAFVFPAAERIESHLMVGKPSGGFKEHVNINGYPTVIFSSINEFYGDYENKNYSFDTMHFGSDE